VLGLADSIAVMYKGRVVAVADNAPGLTKAIIGEYMLGLREEPRPAGQRGGGGAP
jgi:simple sugar transport system ATP-binding protein